MDDNDFLARIKELYQPPKGKFVFVDVPAIRYLAIEGHGDPKTSGIDTAMSGLWAIAQALAPIAKQQLGRNFKYPPLQCQFWAEQQSLLDAPKEDWRWRVMVVIGNWATEHVIDTAKSNTASNVKLTAALLSMKVINLHEQQCVQYMHVGDYEGISKVCTQLYQDFLPQNNLQPNGYYHEIYLNDPSKTVPAKRKIIIRQPVTPM